MRKPHRALVALLIIIPIALIVIVGVFVKTQHGVLPNNAFGVGVPSNPELTSLVVPYYSIADLSGIGPYSSNRDAAGYTHDGLDFMSDHDLVEYRAVSGGKVIEAKLFYDKSRSDTHPQVNVIVLYNKNTKVVYTFEPFSKDIAVAERQMTLMNVQAGDTIVAGQSLGKLIKTAPSHMYISMS